MSIFASKTAESMNRDPHPNVWDGHSPRDQMRADTDMFRKGAPVGVNLNMTYLHRPRPEFTPQTTHPANPILVALRKDGDTNLVSAVRWWLDAIQQYRQGDHLTLLTNEVIHGAGPDAVDHAHRVLVLLREVTR